MSVRECDVCVCVCVWLFVSVHLLLFHSIVSWQSSCSVLFHLSIPVGCFSIYPMHSYRESHTQLHASHMHTHEVKIASSSWSTSPVCACACFIPKQTQLTVQFLICIWIDCGINGDDYFISNPYHMSTKSHNFYTDTHSIHWLNQYLQMVSNRRIQNNER